MKKILVLLAFVGLSLGANAQDIILKQDGSEIKAKVLEITDQQIKYKEFDFQDGPTRNINISEVFMITYENGKREVFNKQTSTQTPQQKPYILSNDEKNEFYEIGTNDKEMLKFFKETDFLYYSNFLSACKMRNSGQTLLAMGIPLTCVGAIFMGIGFSRNYEWAIAGYTLIGVGQVLTIVSIPVSAVAGGRKKSIKNDFEREYFKTGNYTYQPTLNINYTGNGVGIALKF